ncbi:MAG: hypothetical protein MSS83_05420 [Methanobrevibacter sp.]|uniref:hypothetical protein n=1 Tax=Methanobrevibacter sp. TaxID=66852 RepID=UPI0031F4F31D|nr:hypothetical protein [Methanobrevibacter sp.]
MKSILKFIKCEMEKLEIPYDFLEWNKKLTFPYFVGEISEIPTLDEDGQSQYQFILTGTDQESTMNMLSVNEKLKNRYKYGYKTLLDNKSGVVIIYDNMLPIPSVDEDIRRIQINLKIKVWEI